MPSFTSLLVFQVTADSNRVSKTKVITRVRRLVSAELRSDAQRQMDRDEAEGNKTKENGNYSPQPRLCPLVCDHQSVIRNWPVTMIHVTRKQDIESIPIRKRFYFWSRQWRKFFFNQSRIVVQLNQSKRIFTFDTQLKADLNLESQLFPM